MDQQMSLFDPDAPESWRLVQKVAEIHWYQQYLQSFHWKSLRDWTLLSRGHRCERCGQINQTNVHHKTYKRLWREREDDLEVLCRPCHVAIHRKQRERRRSGRIAAIPQNEREAA